MEQTSRITIPEKNLAKMVTALLDSGYWIKTEKLFDALQKKFSYFV